ncbi:hypothetical protein BT69DRAFT_1080203 [Atractiella rhizophila]|nr:hypothetical protein BT69DRAFT_1080203 [Atractiella rhizophila]
MYIIVILIVGAQPNQTSSEEIWPVGIPYEIRLNRMPAQGIKRMGAKTLTLSFAELTATLT